MNFRSSRRFRLLSILSVSLFTSSSLAQGQANIQRLNPDTLHKPHGYTHVVVVRSGKTVYIAGQVPLDKQGNLVGAGDFSAQVRQAFENLAAALKAAGVGFSDVVNMNTYVTDLSQIDKYREIRAQYMKADLPAATLVEVKSLFRSDVMIEMNAVAVAH